VDNFQPVHEHSEASYKQHNKVEAKHGRHKIDTVPSNTDFVLDYVIVLRLV
jgi:hypothetical protein